MRRHIKFLVNCELSALLLILQPPAAYFCLPTMPVSCCHFGALSKRRLYKTTLPNLRGHMNCFCQWNVDRVMCRFWAKATWSIMPCCTLGHDNDETPPWAWGPEGQWQRTDLHLTFDEHAVCESTISIHFLSHWGWGTFITTVYLDYPPHQKK